MRRFLSAFWLALALLIGQQAAALHALGHATEQLQQKKDSAPAPSSCDLCIAYAQFSGAAGSKVAALPVVAAAAVAPLDFVVAGSPAAARLAFRSRAPPTLL